VLKWCGSIEEVTLASTVEEIEAALAELMLKRFELQIVGLDTEWGASREVAVLQMAWKGHCLLCLLPCHQLQDSPSLRSILEDASVVKAGVGIAQDAQMLRSQAGIDVRGCCDLFLLAAKHEVVPASQPCSLASLTQLLLSIELPKDEQIRRSDWAHPPLSGEQLAYAARDALAGRDCMEVLVSTRDTGSRVAEWCIDLLDRAPKLRSGNNKQHAPSEKILHCRAYAGVQKFGNRRIVDSSGRLMLHMRDRTVDGLLRRGLASVIEDECGEAVQLHFRPLDRYDYAGLDAAERNACVGCGSSGVARYYVVPHMFFVHLPDVCKSYNCHDVVMLCPRCRFKAEPAQEALV